jgi:leader peptidase (prepilin peptidase)/N-methyltransferase
MAGIADHLPGTPPTGGGPPTVYCGFASSVAPPVACGSAGAAALIATATAIAGLNPWTLAAAYAAMLVVAIAAAMVDTIELRLPDAMTYPILAAGVLTMAVLEITGTHQALVRGILGGLLYGGLLLIAGLLDPRSYALDDIKLSAGLGVWLAGHSWTSLFIGVLTAQVLLLLVGRIGRA